MKPLRFTSEHLLIALAFLLGMGLRLINLGYAPLSDYEAKWALQALSIARGENIAIGSQPGYIMLSGFLFWIFGSSNFLARFVPALAGSCLILSPLLFRSRLKQLPTLILVFALALDPGLVGISRLAGGSMLAASCAILAIGFAINRRPVLTGIFAGLALLSGSSLWIGALALSITLLILRWRKQLPFFDESIADFLETQRSDRQSCLLRGILSMAITIALVASLFLRYPHGLGAWLLSISDFFKGWVTPSGVPALRLAAGLLVYQPLAVIFGLIGIAHIWINPSQTHLHPQLVKGLALCSILSLLTAFVYIGRSMGDLVWTLIPLWTLAALELGYLFNPVESPIIVFGEATLTFVILCITWLLFSAIASTGGVFMDWLQLAQLIGSLSLLVLAAYLFSTGWGWKVSRAGLVWGSVIFLSLYMLSATWGVSQYSAGGKRYLRQELWYPAPLTGNADLFTSALSDLSLWHTNHRNTIDIRLAVDAPSMLWILRDFSNVKQASIDTPVADISHLPPEQLPSIIITYPLDGDLNLSAAYRGQDFSWQIYPSWDGALPFPALSWLVFRNAPEESVQVTLWARADLFPGGDLEIEETSQVTP